MSVALKWQCKVCLRRSFVPEITPLVASGNARGGIPIADVVGELKLHNLRGHVELVFEPAPAKIVLGNGCCVDGFGLTVRRPKSV